MKRTMYGFATMALTLVLVVAALPATSRGAAMSDYCIVPPFIQQPVPANLLLMIDNSASMYDLAYVDKGYKSCSVTTSRTCSYDTDCPAGETCTNFLREPYYCYDETYKGSNTYAGYFVSTTFYYYRPATDDFAPVASAFPSGCGSTVAGSTTKSIANTMCLEYSVSGSTKTLDSFVAVGNYLNWLTASKFDIEKQILTGGRVRGGELAAESRGCVGQGYVKNALTADFENYAGASTNDPNYSLGVTFTVRGPAGSSSTAPSPGGPTYIDLFSSDTPFKYADCQAAINALATGNNAQIKTTVSACLASTAPSAGYCQQKTSMSCTTSTDCVLNAGLAQTAFVCSGNPLRSCTGTTDTSCNVPAAYACTNKSAMSCTGPSDTTSCKVTTVEKLGTCGSWSPALPNGNQAPTTCSSTSPCTWSKTSGHTTTTYTGTCSGYTAGGTTDYGPCAGSSAVDYSPCTSNYVGACVLPGTTVATKTKVSFQQSMQACWQVRNGHPIGIDDINTVKNQCSDIYGGLYTCSDNPTKTCSGTTDTTTCGAGNTCVGGPAAIGPGNPALLCGQGYEGDFYTWNGAAWVLITSLPGTLTSGMTSAGCTSADSVETCMEKVHTQFCSVLQTPNVTDPTDAPSDTATYDNLPSIISGIGVEAQLGQPIKSMRVRVAETPQNGLIQQFAGQIRIGLMSFNYSGDAYELTNSILTVPRVCSNDPTRHCSADTDCLSGGSCANLDGGQIIYDVGKGKCADAVTKVIASPNVVCTTDRNCGSGQVCVMDTPGDHVTSGTLIYTLDSVKANTWTPFAEAFYSAIGYYSSRKVCDNDATRYCKVDSDCASGHKCNQVVGTSRTDLQLNSSDFNASYYPSQYSCQANYVLLITDGMATADRHSSAASLANMYSTAKPSQGPYAASTCSYYAGSTYLETLAWLAKNRNIDTLSVDPTSPSTDTPTKSRERINTYVVFNGENSGAAGDCNSYNLLNNTATAGGTTMKVANDPVSLRNALQKVFTEVAAQTSSGTAASILSNSEGSGANILQAIFYPLKSFDDNVTSVNWIGEMQNLWYYVDPFIGNSTMREDSDYSATNLAANDPHYFNLTTDKVTKFYFDSVANQTMVNLYRDVDGNGSPDVYLSTVIPEDVKSIWRAGKQLWKRTSARNIYTQIGSGLVDISTLASDTNGQNYLQTPGDSATATKIIDYVKGTDDPSYRSRSVVIPSVDTTSRVWKLGDIVSSTPRVQSSVRLNYYDFPPPGGYYDKTYGAFLLTTSYQNRGMAYVGANDGMLHAFKQGKLNVAASGDLKATLSGTNLGEEQWGFVPKNALPYLNYLTDPNYTHLFFVEGESLLADVSIKNPATCSGSYWDCVKDMPGTPAGNPGGTNWATVLVGSMGIGGASRDMSGTCSDAAHVNCVKTPVSGVGYSSYFALDVTNQSFDPSTGALSGPPTFLWEFTNAALGYATSGAAIVKVSARTSGTPDPNKNGRWFAVLASGPTGPIDGTLRQFKAKSDQTLKLFILDLKDGTLLNTIDTGIANAFAGRITGGVIDADRSGLGSPGNYQDDAVYIGYVKQASDGTDNWTDGGVIRLMTKEDPDPANWQWSTVIDSIGAVTTNISRIQDTKNKNLWLYFGTGRYYYAQDDMSSPRRIFGVKEPCYTSSNTLDGTCTTSFSGVGNLTDKTSNVSDTLTSGTDKGWYINLDGQNTPDQGYGAERSLTDPVSMTNGAIFFQTFKPSADPCAFGGNSYMWVVKYDTGAPPPAAALEAKALIQLSTGSFQEMDLGSALTDKGGRRSGAMTGFTSTTAAPIVSKSNLKPVKRILHILEH